jgi:DNA-binding GntR family transcriptional regulator
MAPGAASRPDASSKAGAGKQPLSSPERVADGITKALLRREYGVGQRLIESDLTQRLGVSRSTVREALKMLAASGVVEIIPYRGAVIRGLTRADAENLLAVLEVLTGLAARQAAANIGKGNNQAAFAAAARPLVDPRPTDELDRILDERARFYQTMLHIAGNAELARAMPTWRAHLFRTQFYSLLTKRDLAAMVTEYRNIAGAILGGDGAKAESCTRRHLRKSAERTLPHLR